MAKPISRKELIRRFRNLGFTGPISGSRHDITLVIRPAASRPSIQIDEKSPTLRLPPKRHWGKLPGSCEALGHSHALTVKLVQSPAQEKRLIKQQRMRGTPASNRLG